MKTRIVVALVALASLIQVAAAQTRDLVDTALATQKFNLFLSLCTDAGITFNLKDSNPITVFAPTDEALQAQYSKMQLDALRANPDRLKTILLHHVFAGRIDAVAAVKRTSLQPLMGKAIPTGIVNGRGVIGGAHFVITNVHTTNGILHGIDRVLLP